MCNNHLYKLLTHEKKREIFKLIEQLPVTHMFSDLPHECIENIIISHSCLS